MSDFNTFKSDRGQTIIVFAVLFSTLVLFTGWRWTQDFSTPQKPRCRRR